MKEKFLKVRNLYEGKAVGFRADEVLLPNKNRAIREYLTHPGAVAILAFLDSPVKKPLWDLRLVLVEQYRYPVGRITEELPAGKLDKGESVLTCLKRELKEETGCIAKRFHFLTSYWPTPAFSNEVIHIYWAEVKKMGKINLDEDEFLRVKIMNFGEALKKIRKGKIQDSKTIVGLLSCLARWQKKKPVEFCPFRTI